MKITDHSFNIFSVVMLGMESDVLVSVDLLQFQIENLRRFQHCLLQFIFFSCLDRGLLSVRALPHVCMYGFVGVFRGRYLTAAKTGGKFRTTQTPLASYRTRFSNRYLSTNIVTHCQFDINALILEAS